MEDVAPQRNRSQHLHVPDTIKSHLGTRECHANTVRNVQKTDPPLEVAANERQYDNVVLLPLIFVDHVDPDARKLTGGHEPSQTVELPGVSGKNSDLGGLVFLTQQIAAKGDHKASLVRVLVTPTIFDFLFKLTMIHKKEVRQDALQIKIY